MLMLYRAGNTHKVRGIECEVGRFQNRSLKTLLDNGWKLRPEDTVSQPEEPTPVEPVKSVEAKAPPTEPKPRRRRRKQTNGVKDKAD